MHRPALHLLHCLTLGVPQDPGRVEPDWPNVANSTTTVAPGAVQIEAGVDVQAVGRARMDTFRFAAPLSLRIGVHERIELRLADGDPWRWAQGLLGARQQGEISVGAKLRLYEKATGTRISLGLQPQLSPTSPRAEARFWAPLPGAVFLTSVEPGAWHLDFNAGIKMRANEGGKCCDAEGVLAASFGRGFADDVVLLWLEAYSRGNLGPGELAEIAGDAGIVVIPTRRVALDLAVVVGQVNKAFITALLGGITVRMGPWHRPR
jgi:hypothetical protein